MIRKNLFHAVFKNHWALSDVKYRKVFMTYRLKRVREINNPFDLAFRMLFNALPEEVHIAFGLPGIFDEKIGDNIFDEKSVKEADAPYKVKPDNKSLFRAIIINIEHQSTPLTPEKLEAIESYEHYLESSYNLYVLIVIASHLYGPDSLVEIEVTNSHIIRPLFVDVSEENLKQRLSTVTDKVLNGEEITSLDIANLAIVAIFAPRDIADDLTEKVVELFKKIEEFPPNTEKVLYNILRVLIDAYFDNVEEYNRMMEMLNENTNEDIIAESEIYKMLLRDIKYYQNIAQKKEAKVSKIANNMERVKAEKNEIEAENRELKAKIAELENNPIIIKDENGNSEDGYILVEAEDSTLKAKPAKIKKRARQKEKVKA